MGARRVGLRRALLDRVAEHPLTVETRGLLLRAECEIFADASAPERAVVRETSARLLAAVGRPGRDELAAATAGLSGWWELIAAIEEEERLVRLLPGWRPEAALIYDWPRDRPGRAREEGIEVEMIHRPRPGLLDHLDGRALDEIGRAVGRVPLAAAFVDGVAASFCYAFLETESLWAVAIETLPGYRRRGLASACARRLTRFMLGRGKRPVWGAHVGNVASQRLADSLGFRPCGRIAALEKPGDGSDR